MTPKYLGIPAFAEYVGLKVGTIRGYLLKNISDVASRLDEDGVGTTEVIDNLGAHPKDKCHHRSGTLRGHLHVPQA